MTTDSPPTGAVRAVHLRWSNIGLVAIGGAVGTATREACALTWPTPAGGFPLTILVINVVGAFALGLLLELLARRGSDGGRRRAVRLLIGTGVLGGFTTYSTFARDVAGLAGTSTGLAFTDVAATLILGIAASTAGISAGILLHRRTGAQDPA